ncbi:hypothetical protein FRB99_005640 [Tulasnella sp. 403]|nr:hypothetical protein FRB99_005640 [Tulasnella sp. 403]
MPIASHTALLAISYQVGMWRVYRSAGNDAFHKILRTLALAYPGYLATLNVEEIAEWIEQAPGVFLLAQKQLAACPLIITVIGLVSPSFFYYTTTGDFLKGSSHPLQFAMASCSIVSGTKTLLRSEWLQYEPVADRIQQLAPNAVLSSNGIISNDFPIGPAIRVQTRLYDHPDFVIGENAYEAVSLSDIVVPPHCAQAKNAIIEDGLRCVAAPVYNIQGNKLHPNQWAATLPGQIVICRFSVRQSREPESFYANMLLDVIDIILCA